MEPFSQEAFFQALGWATINSFWQVGLMWCVFVLVRRWFPLSSGRQFFVSVGAILLSFVFFILSFWLYLIVEEPLPVFYQFFGAGATSWLPMMLTSASVSYLVVLAFPLFKLLHNLAFIRRLRKIGNRKADINSRLFVNQTAHRLGIKKNVRVSFSTLIHSPLTIGFFKPIILLPFASFNQLTLQQAEAVLLHELAHIRRHDFLINLVICVVHTLLYFNPFVRLFVHAAERSREDCCDALVLQFGYDPLAYASALLQLEKARQPLPHLTLNATGKHHLLSRIESIVGLPSAKPSLKLHHFGGLMASILCVLALHSLILRTNKPIGDGKLLMEIANPFAFTYERKNKTPAVAKASPSLSGKKIIKLKHQDQPWVANTPISPITSPIFETPQAIQVARQENALAQLAAEEQQAVQQMVEQTRKTLEQFEWKELEKSIGEALTEEENAAVRQEYIAEVDNINWNNLAQNMAAQYEQTDWQRLQSYIQMAQSQLQKDSLVIARDLATCQAKAALQESLNTAPNAIKLSEHAHELEQLQTQLKHVQDSLYRAKKRPVIKL